METREIVDRLQKLDCDIMQGFYFSKPVLPEDFISLTGVCENPDKNQEATSDKDILTLNPES